jgi:hypothetical protein
MSSWKKNNDWWPSGGANRFVESPAPSPESRVVSRGELAAASQDEAEPIASRRTPELTTVSLPEVYGLLRHPSPKGALGEPA